MFTTRTLSSLSQIETEEATNDTSGVLRLKVATSSTSEKLILGKYTWQMEVKKGHDNKMNIKVSCNEDNESQLWNCFASVCVICKMGQNDKEIQFSTKTFFNSENNCVTQDSIPEDYYKLQLYANNRRQHRMHYGNGMNDRELEYTGDATDSRHHHYDDSGDSDDSGRTRNCKNPIIDVIEAHIMLLNDIGFRIHSLTDFSEPNHQSDVVFEVENKKFYLNKAFLNIHSTYFQILFGSDFAEKSQKVIQFNVIKAAHFEELMHVLYPSEKKITNDNAMHLLELADMFDLQVVVAKCENFLTSTISNDNVLSRLKLADKYHLPMLLGKCLDNMKTSQEVKKIVKSPEFNMFSAAFKLHVMEQVFKFM